MSPPPPPPSPSPSPAPRVRAATVEDADTIAALEAAGAHRPWSQAQVVAHLAMPASCSLLALLDGVPVGWALATAAADEGELCSVGAHPASRRRGVGRLLIEALHAAWRAQGVRTGWLEVRRDNAAARALYLAAGWTEAGARRRYYADGEDAIVYRWDAGD